MKIGMATISQEFSIGCKCQNGAVLSKLSYMLGWGPFTRVQCLSHTPNEFSITTAAVRAQVPGASFTPTEVIKFGNLCHTVYET